MRSPVRWPTSSALDQAGLRVEHVRLVVLTHAHVDHCGQAPPIAERAGCEVWLHPRHQHRLLISGDHNIDAHVAANRSLVAERLERVRERLADGPLAARELEPRLYGQADTDLTAGWLESKCAAWLTHLAA